VTGRVVQAPSVVGKLVNATDAVEAKAMAEWLQRRQELRAAVDLESAALCPETDACTKSLEAEVEGEFQARLSSGDEAVQQAKNGGARLRLDALSSEGGRIWLARETATLLNLHEVWLDSRDPQMPSMLDLDALVDLLLGAEGREDVAVATDGSATPR